MTNIFVNSERKKVSNSKQKGIPNQGFANNFLSLENLTTKLLFGFSIGLFSTILASCSNGNNRDYLQRNGTVHCDTDMKFCLDSVSGDWYNISKDAINAVNRNSAFSFSVVYGREGRTVSHFHTYSSRDGTNAYNHPVDYSGSRNIRNDIYFNTYYMGRYSYSEKRTLALHEMGHTLGLIDIPDDKAKGYSVMYKSFNKGYPTFSDYPEYDRNNITWFYGGNWR